MINVKFEDGQVAIVIQLNPKPFIQPKTILLLQDFLKTDLTGINMSFRQPTN